MDHNERKKHFERMMSHDPSSKKWKCLICNVSVSRKTIAIDHIEGVHLQIPSYPCEYCESIFNSNVERRKHKHNKHKAEIEITKLENFHRNLENTIKMEK